MFTIKTAALSAMIGLTALAGIPATAQADSLYLNSGNGPSIGVQYGSDRGEYRHYDNRDDWSHRDDWRDRRSDRGCSADRALDKADRLGLRRARVVDVGRRTISVAGRKFDRRMTVTFARAPGCPILSR